MKNKISLDEKLKVYSESNTIPMHMPGHKRNIELLGNKLPYEKDITEIYDFDDLHHAEGILKDISLKATSLFHSKKSYLLVNGSTCGILAGIRSLVSFGDQVLVARNAHKSIYHAIELNHLRPIYLNPEVDEVGICQEITSKSIEEELEKNKNIKLVILTSPTYEGIISDVKKIVEVCHKREVFVFVDAAHGAHFPFVSSLSKYDAVQCGADIVVESLHKTLPSLTQTAILHVQGSVSLEEVSRNLAIFETSSPSYLLIDSMDICFDFLLEKGKRYFSIYEDNLLLFYEKTKSFKKLKIYGNNFSSNYDYGKIVVLVKDTNITGRDLANILREKYNIEVEMSSRYYVILMTSVCDSKDNFQKVVGALSEIDDSLSYQKEEGFCQFLLPDRKSFIYEVMDSKNYHFVNIFDSVGRVSLEYIELYPPGIPIIVPGEVISEDIVNRIKKYLDCNLELHCTYQKFPNIKVLD